MRPWERSWGSKVPMQPRRDLWPRLETVFHVTKRGCSFWVVGGEEDEDADADADADAGERREKEKNEEMEEDLELSYRAAREEVAEREDGVEELEPVDGVRFCSRDMLGRWSSERGTGCWTGWSSSSLSLSSESDCSNLPSSSSSSSSSASSSSRFIGSDSGFSSRCLLSLNSAHKSCTRARSKHSRFSKLAERASKQ